MKYRKKPVVVEVEEFADLGRPGINQMRAHEIASWIAGHDNDQEEGFPDYGSNYIIIETLEGDMTVSLGDFVIQGVHGEFYPCKPDIFAETYEAVSDE